MLRETPIDLNFEVFYDGEKWHFLKKLNYS